MKLFRRSLIEDSVDGYNNTWAVCVLLLLAITTWLLPLALIKDEVLTLPSRPYTAKCFYPREFSGAMQEYAGSACTSAFQRSIQGDYGDSNEGTEPATLYLMDWNIPAFELNPFRPNNTDNERELRYYSTNLRLQRLSQTPPVVLVILALLLKLPYILRAFLSRCIGIRTDQVLEAVISSDLPVDGRRRDTNSDVLTAVSEYASSSSKKASVLYLVTKFLACLGVATVLFVSMLQYLFYLRNFVMFPIVKAQEESEYYTKFIFVCQYKIRQLQTIQTFSSQCIFSVDRATGGSSSAQTSNEYIISELYGSLYFVLTLLFVVLTVANVVSFVMWLLRLVPGPYRRQFLSSKVLPMDVCLMLYMAEDNCGILTARALKGYLVTKKEPFVVDEQEMEKTG